MLFIFDVLDVNTNELLLSQFLAPDAEQAIQMAIHAGRKLRARICLNGSLYDTHLDGMATDWNNYDKLQKGCNQISCFSNILHELGHYIEARSQHADIESALACENGNPNGEVKLPPAYSSIPMGFATIAVAGPLLQGILATRKKFGMSDGSVIRCALAQHESDPEACVTLSDIQNLAFDGDFEAEVRHIEDLLAPKFERCRTQIEDLLILILTDFIYAPRNVELTAYDEQIQAIGKLYQE